jgi:PAS domain S-box-containing protein
MSIINGYTIEEMLKWSPKDMVNLVHPEDLPNVIEQFNRTIASTGDQFVNNIYRLITKDGTIKWVESYGKEFIYEGDYASLISVIDRTEIIETELKLKESEERYRLIYENANDLIRVLNDRFEFEYLNEKVHKRILGYSKEDLIGQTHLPFLHPDDRRNAIKSTVRNLKRGKGSYQARFKDKKGNYRWFEFSATIFFDRKGEKKILSIARDIGERKRAEEELKRSEERYRLISQNAEENLFIFDMNMKLIYNDTSVPNILGYSYEEMKKLKLTDYNVPSSLKIALKAYREEIRNERKKIGDPKRIRTFEVEQIHKDGSIVNVETRFTFLRDKSGTATGILGLSRNISKRKQAEQKLTESEEKFRLIAEQTLVGISIIQNGKLKYINRAFGEIHEYTVEEMYEQTMDDLINSIHPDDVRLVREKKNLRETGDKRIHHLLFRIKTKSGKLRWLDNVSRVIQYDGKDALLSTIVDITERKQAEQKLRESEERYRLISQNADENLFIFDMNLNVIYHDPNVPNILGYTNDEISELKLTDYNEPSSLKILLKAYKEELRNERKKIGDPKRIRMFEIDQIHKDGSIVNVEVKFTFLRDENGIAKGIISITRDISKRKQAEQKLRESEEKYRLISETAYDLIGMLNKRFKYEYINENAFKQILGYSSSEILGKSALKFIHPDDVSMIARELFDGFKEGRGGGVLRFKHKKGHWVWLEAKGKTFFDRDGRLKAIVISRDITEQRESEEQLKESETKYRKAYNRATFYKDLFGHDMNNILTVINSSADLIPYYLTESEKSKNIRSVINILQNQVSRGAKLVSNVNALSELEETLVPIKPVNVNKCLENSIDFVKSSFKDRDLKIDVNSNGSHFEVQANQLLREVFDNVLINAIKYNDNSNVEILVKISEDLLDSGSFVKMEFIDNGIGVPDERKSMIFKRGNRELKGSKGMGIGLSLVKKILQSYKGRIWVEDKVKGDYSKGSKFVFLIPRFEDA